MKKALMIVLLICGTIMMVVGAVLIRYGWNVIDEAITTFGVLDILMGSVLYGTSICVYDPKK